MVVRLPQRCEMHPRGRIIIGRSENPTSSTSVDKKGAIEIFESNDLWEKQFNRWWGWNWLRKRKKTLSKFKINSTAREHFKTVKRVLKIGNESYPEYLKKINTIDTKNDMTLVTTISPTKPTTSKTLTRTENKKCETEPSHMEKPSSTIDIEKKPVRLKVRRKKTVQENIESLKSRLHSLESCLDSDNNNLKAKSEQLFQNKSVLNNGINYLPSIDINDMNYIPMPKFCWVDRFEHVRKEHKHLLRQVKEDMEYDFNMKINYESQPYYFNYPKRKNKNNEKNLDSEGSLDNNNNIKENLQKDDNLLEIETKKNYDINFINNNILSVASQISDIKFLYLKKTAT